MSPLRIDPDSLSSFFPSTSATTFRPDPVLLMCTQNPTRTTSTPPVEAFGSLANTTPRTGYEPKNIHEVGFNHVSDTRIFDQTADHQEKASHKCFRKVSRPKSRSRKSAASTVPTMCGSGGECLWKQGQQDNVSETYDFFNHQDLTN